MAHLAILGFGIVGSGVLEVVRKAAPRLQNALGAPLTVKYICDIRDFSSHPDAPLFVSSLEPILADADVRVVVETIGGLNPAYGFVKQALQSGRHVVTSNKELVANHGAELLALAKQQGVAFLFEASVGGGTPIIGPMAGSLLPNRLTSIAGIVNGTTNFMLTQMAGAGMDFDAALQEAQARGYAETIDPSYDVDGPDAARKIAILASIASGRQVWPQNVPTRGIRGITPADIAAAAALGATVKLIAWAKNGAALSVGVEPMLVPRACLLAGVDDVFNAVLVHGDVTGDVLFYGQGAGSLPTAAAVVADCVTALIAGTSVHQSLFWQPADRFDGFYDDPDAHDYYLRMETEAGLAALLALPGATAVAGAPAALLPGRTVAELHAAEARLQQQGHPAALALRLWA